MTDAELRKEWDYRYKERIGCLVGKGEPDADQRQMASDEADKAVEELRKT